MIKTLAASLMTMAVATTAANAVTLVTVTAEAPGVENTTQALVAPAIATFNAAPLGVNTGLTQTSGGGTTATIDTVNIQSADAYGGAGGAGHYAAVLSGHTTTITFTGTPTQYVGFWASAIDSGSSVTVYNGATVLYTHNLPLVPVTAINFGNPDAPFHGQNASQAYAYFNINASSFITSVVFSQAPSGGNFEFDNLTVGTVPEPAAWALMVAGFAMVGFSVRRRTFYATA